MKHKSIGYPGSKFGAGVYQNIINEIPPHKTYIELFKILTLKNKHMKLILEVLLYILVRVIIISCCMSFIIYHENKFTFSNFLAAFIGIVFGYIGILTDIRRLK